MPSHVERAAEVLIKHPVIPDYQAAGPAYICPTCRIEINGSCNSPDHATHQARALADAHLLAAPVDGDLRDALIQTLRTIGADRFSEEATDALLPTIATHVTERERSLQEQIERLRENRRKLMRRDREQCEQISELLARGE